MDELWNGKYKTRVNYDTYEPEVLIAGVWVDLQMCLYHEKKVLYGDVRAIEAIREKYGDEVANELDNSTTDCKHRFVFSGISDNQMGFKCHECGIHRIVT